MLIKLAVYLEFYFLFPYVCTYNIDTNFPIVYSSPAQSSNLKVLKRNAYFGYSVIMYSSPGTQPWVQIAAPRGNSSKISNVDEPGVVYRCNIKEACTFVLLDESGNSVTEDESGAGSLHSLSNNSWIGVAMDVQRPEDGGRAVVCGHRWKTISEDEIYMPGICFSMSNETTLDNVKYHVKLYPLVKEGRANVAAVDGFGKSTAVPDYGFGAMGISVHLPDSLPWEKDSELVIGAPGIYIQTGGIVQYSASNVKKTHVPQRKRRNVSDDYQFHDHTVLELSKQSSKYLNSLFGYYVSAGCFLQKRNRYYVVGIPRYKEKGRVLVFKMKKHSDNVEVSDLDKENSMVIGENEGLEGSYFGSSIAVADLDNNGLDDLIVGAPRYSYKQGENSYHNGYDEGIIYVYLGNEDKQQFMKADIKIPGIASRGQFGLCITSLGDLDADGFHDIAVGAPYENNGQGAIYIFNGMKDGLTKVHSQRIGSEEFHIPLYGFGISMSKGNDIDGNNYNDLAIGAYLSQHVVILRSYPVIRVYLNIYAPEQLNKTGTFTFRVCQKYKSDKRLPTLNLTRQVISDSRAKILNQRHQVLLLKDDTEHCKSFTAELLKTVYKTPRLPLEISVQNILPPIPDKKDLILINKTKITGKDEYCSNCPLIYQGHSWNKTLKIPFRKHCADKICQSNLHLHCSLPELRNNIYVAGSGPLKLCMNVTSSGPDDAENVQIITKLSNYFSLASVSPNCETENIDHDPTVKCKIDSVLNASWANHSLWIDMAKADKENFFKVDIQSRVKTTNAELDESDNKCTIEVNLIREIDFIVTGKTSEIKPTTEDDFSFIHTIQVDKLGTSNFKKASINISIPESMTDKIKFLKIGDIQAAQGKQKLTCENAGSQPLMEEMPIINTDESLRNKRSTDMNVAKNETLIPPVNRTLFLNCSSEDIICSTVICYLDEFPSRHSEPAVIRILMLVHPSKLAKYMKLKDIIYITTNASAHILNTEKLNPDFNHRKRSVSISTQYIGKTKEGKIELWVIIISVIAGVLLLTLVIMGMAKAGFFRRKKKEELEALKNTSVAEEINEGFTIFEETEEQAK